MNFDLKPRVMGGQKEVGEYLASYDVRLPSKIEVKMVFTGDRYLASCRRRVLPSSNPSSGVKLAMTPFVRNVLAHFKIPPSQLTPGADQAILGFKALYATLCATYIHVSYRVE